MAKDGRIATVPPKVIKRCTEGTVHGGKFQKIRTASSRAGLQCASNKAWKVSGEMNFACGLPGFFFF